MPVRTSSYTIDAAAKTASLAMASGDAAIPTVELADGIVTLQARPQLTFSMSDLRFFVAEARHWITAVGARLNSTPNVPLLLGGYFSYNYTVTGTSEMLDSVTVNMQINNLADTDVLVSGTWTRPSGDIVLAVRPPAKIRWYDYIDLVHLFEELVEIVETGKRT